MLSLAEIEKWHDGSLLVLWGVPCENLFHDFEVCGVEFEGDAGVVFGSIAMLYDEDRFILES